MLPPISISDYTYALPTDRIASYPIPQRDQSKLLLYVGGAISHHTFHQLPDLLPVNSLLFFNDTKVISARFLFEKDSGGQIEVFLLEPSPQHYYIGESLAATTMTKWKCAIGNLKRWKDDVVLRMEVPGDVLEAKLSDRQNGIVEFHWSSGRPFSEILPLAGKVPLPPYIKRVADDSDKERYQTVYSKHAGAVAAPTAGLHFTDTALNQLKINKISTDHLTLHVSAGTFLPVKVDNVLDHEMHEEQLIVYRHNLENLLVPSRKVVAVGTTVARTLESLYWYGVMLIEDRQATFDIAKLYPYQRPDEELPAPQDAIRAVLSKMESDQVTELLGTTSILIVPGYQFRICEGLVTNFHQPGSTLLLLIAAFIGKDWKRVYTEALANNYRFLSYGDSSLLLPTVSL